MSIIMRCLQRQLDFDSTAIRPPFDSSSTASWPRYDHSTLRSTYSCQLHCGLNKQVVGGRPPQYAPAPLLPTWAPKRLPPPSRRQRSSSFPRPTRSHAHRCSRLTRQHGGDLDLWPFDLKSGVRVTCVTWATSVPMLVFLGLSVLDLGPMYATYRRQTIASLNAPAY